MCVHYRRLERQTVRSSFCCKYSSAVLPPEVSSIHISSVTKIGVCCVSRLTFSVCQRHPVFVCPAVANKIFLQCRLHLERIFLRPFSLCVGHFASSAAALLRSVADRVQQCCNVARLITVVLFCAGEFR